VINEDTGRLHVGGKADIVVFDPDAHWQLCADTIVSSGKNSPFLGYELEGRARVTIVGGDIRLGG
jgi:dihydroorotase